MRIEDQTPVSVTSGNEVIKCHKCVSVGACCCQKKATLSAMPAAAATRTAKSFGDRSNHNEVRSKISRVAPSGRLTVERTDVGDVNKSNEENEILPERLLESKGEQPDLVLQSLRSENSHDASPDDDRRRVHSHILGKAGQTYLLPEYPKSSRTRQASTEVVYSVERDTTMRSGFATEKEQPPRRQTSIIQAAQTALTDQGVSA
jgi:hypothetical protein